MKSLLESALEEYEERGQALPDYLGDGNVEFEYKYDFSAFFQRFPFFNVSEFARSIGINPSLMRRYKEKHRSRFCLGRPIKKKRLS